MQPLAVILQHKLVAAWRVLQRNAVDRARAVDAHASSCLHASHQRTCQPSEDSWRCIQEDLYRNLQLTTQDLAPWHEHVRFTSSHTAQVSDKCGGRVQSPDKGRAETETAFPTAYIAQIWACEGATNGAVPRTSKTENKKQSAGGGSQDLVAAGDAGELVAGPDAEDGADGEVGVHDGGTVQGVECDAEALSLHVHRLRDLLAARVLHHPLQRAHKIPLAPIGGHRSNSSVS